VNIRSSNKNDSEKLEEQAGSVRG